jgi:hypothetical protein
MAWQIAFCIPNPVGLGVLDEFVRTSSLPFNLMQPIIVVVQRYEHCTYSSKPERRSWPSLLQIAESMHRSNCSDESCARKRDSEVAIPLGENYLDFSGYDRASTDICTSTLLEQRIVLTNAVSIATKTNTAKLQ